MKKLAFISAFLLIFISVSAQKTSIGLLKYNGGGDWYANPTSLPNLIAFCNKNLKTNIAKDAVVVEAGSSEIFNLPFVHATGHGNIVFSSLELDNLRNYLIGGGFIHFDDNYGMDPFIRLQIKKLFPEYEMVELPPSHPIFHQMYDFPNGLPKIHEHDKKPPQAFGIIHNGRLVLLYTHESDLGDGWEDANVHKNSDETRLKALRMGANIIQYVLMANDPIK